MATLIALFLMLTMTISLVALPNANAQGTKKTYAFIGAIPNPVGVGQEVLLHVGIIDPLQRSNDSWTGITVTVTKPDGTTETLNNNGAGYKTDSTGGTGVVYVPTMTGNYTLQSHFPEQVTAVEIKASSIPAGTTMLASDSEKLTLVVTEEPLKYYPGVPLPTEYWTRTIDAQRREWAPIAGNWLWGYDGPPDRVAPDNDGPETAHILWAKELEEGGLIGGEYGSLGFEHGDGYQGKWSNPVVIAGTLFYNRHISTGGAAVEQKVVAVDLHTGEERWVRTLGNNETLQFGQILYWQTMNMYGAFPYLWTITGTTWSAYDPFTGRWEYTMRNVPKGIGIYIYGQNGEILIYTVNLANGWMSMWNSTKVVFTASGGDASWQPVGKTYTGADVLGLQWNVTIPIGLPGEVQLIYEDRMLGSNTQGSTGSRQPNPVFWALSLKPGQEGQLLFNTTWTLPIVDLHVDIPPGKLLAPSRSQDCGVFIVAAKDTRQYWGFSLDTGKQLWGPTKALPYLDAYSIIYSKSMGTGHIAYGKLFSSGMAGVVNAYDVKTGEHLWTYEATDEYSEILWSNNWPLFIMYITDGKIYLHHLEHSGNQPLPRGGPFVCLNATTGEVIFEANGFFRSTRAGGQPIIADSIIATMDTYDNCIYAIGKGPSATTVTVGPEVSVHGSSVIVKGMVTDVSPGTEDYALTARFPSGVPAVSDESMSDWMLYVYKQFPRPANATGVEVTLDAVDPNGNWIHIGTVTSDSSGMFKKMFTPEVPGEYTVIATFAGSEGYWPSYAETAIGVDEAPPAPAAPEPAAPLPPYETYTIGTGIAIIIAVAIATILILRKRP